MNHDNGGLLLFALIALVGMVRFRWAAKHPDLPCQTCDGKGRFPNPLGRGTRPCRSCGGRGRKERTATKLWDAMFGGGDE